MSLRLVRILLGLRARRAPRPMPVFTPPPPPVAPVEPSLEAELSRMDRGGALSASHGRGGALAGADPGRRPNGPAPAALRPRPGRQPGHRTLHDALRRRGCQRPPESAR